MPSFRGLFAKGIRAPLLVSVALVLALGTILYVQLAVKRIEEELPLRVMQEKRDMETIARHYYDFLTATEAALTQSTDGNLAAIKDNLNIVVRDLKSLRESYSFNTLIGASALHAAMSPAVDDVRIWLTEGFGNLSPEAPVVLDLVATRTRETLSRVYDKTSEADRIAYEILERQSAELQVLRDRLILALAAVAALAGVIVWLSLRQQRAIRERAQADSERNLAQAQLREALESTSEGFAFFDRDERLVIANGRYREFFFGAIKDAVTIGARFEAIAQAAVDQGLIGTKDRDTGQWLEERLARFRGPGGTFSQRYADGRWVQVNERRTTDGGMVAVYSDITELKHRELELMQAKEAAESASEAKSNFLANVSHELRTPLTSILGFARIIERRMANVVFPAVEQPDARQARAMEQIRQNLEIIRIEGDRLTKLINDVLDLEKIEAGEIAWDIGTVDLADTVSQASAATESLYRQKGLALETEIPTGLPPVRADRDRLVQVLVNLISNGIKFTDTGKVRCSACLSDTNKVVVTVSDTGCGIAPDDLKTVFEKFRQVGDTLTEKPVGTGLGLAICREIIEYLGGTIRVESEPDRGSRFIFSLPVAAEDQS